MSLTSVIMVSYQTGPLLFQAIAKVLAQNEPVELCLVDNGNPPEIVQQLEAIARGESRLRFITGHGNVGFSKGCNLGAKASSGEFLLFLNPDCLMPSDTLRKLLIHSVALRRPWMIGARILNDDGSDQRGCRRALLTPKTAFIEAFRLGMFFPNLRLNFDKELVPEEVVYMPAISGAFMFVPRDDFWKIGGFDEGYFLHVEDLDLCLRFRRARGEIYFAPDVIVTHIGSTSEVTSEFIEKHKARSFTRYFHKNFSSIYPVTFLWLLDLAIWTRAWIKILRRPEDHKK